MCSQVREVAVTMTGFGDIRWAALALAALQEVFHPVALSYTGSGLALFRVISLFTC